MIITQGGMTGGWAIYIHQGRLVFDYNHSELRYDHIVSDEVLPPNTTEIEVRFDYDGTAFPSLSQATCSGSSLASTERACGHAVNTTPRCAFVRSLRAIVDHSYSKIRGIHKLTRIYLKC